MTGHYPLARCLVWWVSPLTGDPLSLLVQKKVGKETHPIIRPCASLRVPSFRHRCQGPAYTGQPWPAMPCAAVLAAYPLRVTCTRPSASGLRHRVGRQLLANRSVLRASVCIWLSIKRPDSRITTTQLRTPLPYRRPSAGVAQEVSGMDAAKDRVGQGRPIPVGLRSGAGAREVWPRSGQPRMSGRVFSLVTFSLRRAAIRGQRESDSAGGPKPKTHQRLDNRRGA